MTIAKESPLRPERARGLGGGRIYLVVSALAGLTLFLRAWQLNVVPPWLWWDEATQGLDAHELLNGHFQVFFPRAMGKEPLYIYLTTPFVAAWDGQTFAVRLAGAVLGALTVPALYAAGRALWHDRPAVGKWAGLAAAGIWATNFWPQSINRIGFQVNAFPLVLTLAVVTWLNWTRRPGRGRALTFGLLAGLTLATYLAARITPLLWVLLYLGLDRARRRDLRTSLPWALAGFAVVAVPMMVHFLLEPQDAMERVSTFNFLQQEGGLADQVRLVWQMAKQIAGGFLGWAGDPIPRHNIPNRPPFSPGLAALFGLGLLAALLGLRKRLQRAQTLLGWWGIVCLPALASANSNPHFPRLLAALPAAFLLAAWPIGWLAGRAPLQKRSFQAIAAGLLALFLAAEGVTTGHAYFETWAHHTDLYTWYQGDLWNLGQRARATPGSTAVVPLDSDSAASLDYAFRGLPIEHLQVDEATVGRWLSDKLGTAGGSKVLVPRWHEEPYIYADPLELVPFYLSREGIQQSEQHLTGFDLLTFTLGPHPQFDAGGQRTAIDRGFGRDLTLLEAEWGAAYPNPERSAATAAAGTPLWVKLTWRLTQPAPSLRVAVDVLDREGHRLGTAEKPLVDPRLQITSWSAETRLHTYVLVDVPRTQAPGPVSLEARVYNHDTMATLLSGEDTAHPGVPLATAEVVAPLQPVTAGTVSISRPVAAMVAPGARLLGADAWPETIAPGQTLVLRLYWETDGAAGRQPFTVLLVGTPVSATLQLPSTAPAGQVIHTYADLRLPPDLPMGSYQLSLRPAVPEAPAVALGEVRVSGRARRFTAPASLQSVPATLGDTVSLLGLVGAPAELPVTPGEPITVTLVWRALRPAEQDLVRFVHVLGPDGRPVAQRDGVPCDGACAAPSWVAGEVIVDDVRIDVPPDLRPGSYPVATGWFDGATQARLPALDGAGQRQANDLVSLPLRLVVSP